MLCRGRCPRRQATRCDTEQVAKLSLIKSSVRGRTAPRSTTDTSLTPALSLSDCQFGLDKPRARHIRPLNTHQSRGMAGGLRKYHTKSRNGCSQCKKRRKKVCTASSHYPRRIWGSHGFGRTRTPCASSLIHWNVAPLAYQIQCDMRMPKCGNCTKWGTTCDFTAWSAAVRPLIEKQFAESVSLIHAYALCVRNDNTC